MALHVRNWERYQHYRDRNPPWIKLYTELLDDEGFLALPDAAKWQLVGLFLLAARRGNVLPEKAGQLKVLLGITGRLYIPELLAARYLVTEDPDASKDASKPASTSASTDASSDASASRARARASAPSREAEAEAEREGETETETDPSSSSAANARDAFFANMPEDLRPKWHMLLKGWGDGLGTPGGKAWTAAQIDAGLAEYLVAESHPTFNARHVVRFVEQVVNRKPNDPNTPGASSPAPRPRGPQFRHGSFRDTRA